MADYKIVIPARYGSSRLPGKPLIMLAGKPMIQHVYERALATGVQDIVIATDDERIRDAALAFGADVVMTSPDHENGTERIAEVAQIKGWDAEAVNEVQKALPNHLHGMMISHDEPMRYVHHQAYDVDEKPPGSWPAPHIAVDPDLIDWVQCIEQRSYGSMRPIH